MNPLNHFGIRRDMKSHNWTHANGKKCTCTADDFCPACWNEMTKNDPRAKTDDEWEALKVKK